MTAVDPTLNPIAPLPPANDGRHRFALSTVIFLRFLASIHLVAFVSFWTQLSGLIGPHGILPAGRYLADVREQIFAAAYFRLPTLCWIFGAGPFLHVLCAVGVVLSLLLFAGIAPALNLALLWVSYLSLVNVGQVFLGFQWDALLLEATLLAIFAAPWALWPGWRPIEPTPAAHLMLRWLLFRLMFLSGVVKLSSGDPTWRNLTALTFHYETQPLPNPLAWWMHQLPLSAHRASCAAMFTIELVVPFFLFAPRPIRHNAALLLAALQVVVALTGNFAFFNFLTIALCLLMLDDAWWRAWRRRPTVRPPSPANSPLRTPPPAWRLSPRRLLNVLAVFVIFYTSMQSLPSFNRAARWPDWFEELVNVVGPFNSLDNYGLFAVMTTSRPELIFEGSDDGREWRPYEFPQKPGDLSRRPPIVAPHQPRLDWQLWFAALGSRDQNPWVLGLCEHLLRGTPEVLALVRTNPFPDHPPHYLRVVRYDYHFTSPTERARTGNWWRRSPLDFFIEPIALR